MKLQKLFLSSLLAMSAISANAQYMGIDTLATTENSSPMVLLNAIHNKNSVFIDQWIKEKGRTIKYQEYSGFICYISEGGSQHEFKFNPKEKDAFVSVTNTLSTYVVFPIFTPCSTLPLSSLLRSYRLLQTPEIVREFGIGGHENLIAVEKSDSAFKIKYAEEFLNGLTANQWDQLPVIVTNEQLPLDFRLKALGMLESFYARRSTNDNAVQKELYNSLTEAVKTSPGSFANKMGHETYLNPYNFMFKDILYKLIHHTNTLRQSNHYTQSGVDQFSLNFWMGKQSFDVKSFQITPQNTTIFDVYLTTYNNAVILKRILKNPKFNINEQNINGETFMHKLFSNNIMNVKDNDAFAPLLRALLNYGADPRLLNSQNESPYMIFEKNRGGSGNAIFEAFALKEYNK